VSVIGCTVPKGYDGYVPRPAKVAENVAENEAENVAENEEGPE
jgi:hypothetical protein